MMQDDRTTSDDDEHHNENNNQEHCLGGGYYGFLGLLDLPIGSIIHLDGGEPLVLQRSDFVGFTNHLLGNDDNGGNEDNDSFHLVTVRASCCTTSSTTSGFGIKERSSSSAVTVGFLVDNKNAHNLIRRYDPTTEEVSAKPVDFITVQNLLDQIRQGRIDPQRVVDYARLTNKKDDDDEQGSNKRSSWKELTRFISPRLLTKRGLAAGDKIVPGAYHDETDDGNLPLKNEDSPQAGLDDGTALIYPSIPIICSSNSSQKAHVQQHLGTKSFLIRMDPSQRTRFVIDPHPGARVLQWVLKEYYDNSWQDLVGDVQLSYVTFLRLHCYSSLIHWRDLVAMLSLVENYNTSSNKDNHASSSGGGVGILEQRQYTDLYIAFLDALAWQIHTMDQDFFDDAELSGDNFLIPSLQRLLQTLSHDVSGDRQLTVARSKLQDILQYRFPHQFQSHNHLPTMESRRNADGNTNIMQLDVEEDNASENDDNDDEEDGPVVVASEDVEASLARIISFERPAQQQWHQDSNMVVMEYSWSIRQQYPLLFAAKLPSEDIVMTCARVLDQKGDVSLVREAADYLEQVEADAHHHRCINHPSNQLDKRD